MLASDDPRSYRHPSNAHPGQANSPLDSTADRWMKARIRIVRSRVITRLIPEVYVEEQTGKIDPTTGVPRGTNGKWIRLTNERTGTPAESVVWTWLPGSAFRLDRAVAVWRLLFNARALIPHVEESVAS